MKLSRNNLFSVCQNLLQLGQPEALAIADEVSGDGKNEK